MQTYFFDDNIEDTLTPIELENQSNIQKARSIIAKMQKQASVQAKVETKQEHVQINGRFYLVSEISTS